VIKFRCREKRPKKKKKNKKDANSRETRDADEGRHGATDTATYAHSDGKSDPEKISGRTGVIASAASDTRTSENSHLVTKATEVKLSGNNVTSETRSPRDKILQLEETRINPSAQTDDWLNLTTGIARRFLQGEKNCHFVLKSIRSIVSMYEVIFGRNDARAYVKKSTSSFSEKNLRNIVLLNLLVIFRHLS
jgi:hypothetical protein